MSRSSEFQRQIATREGRVEIAHEMRAKGHTIAEIARALGVCDMTASVYVWENGGFQKGLATMDVRPLRGTVPQYPGHRPAQEQDLR